MSIKKISVNATAAGYLLAACIVLLSAEVTAPLASSGFKGLVFQPGKKVAANSGKTWKDSGDYIYKDPSLTSGDLILSGSSKLKRVPGPVWLKGSGDTTAVSIEQMILCLFIQCLYLLSL
jgi:hypothetical protein